jgi:hypothetical protein
MNPLISLRERPQNFGYPPRFNLTLMTSFQTENDMFDRRRKEARAVRARKAFVERFTDPKLREGGFGVGFGPHSAKISLCNIV